MAWYNPATWTVVDDMQGQNGVGITGKGTGGIDLTNVKQQTIGAPYTTKKNTGIKLSNGGGYVGFGGKGGSVLDASDVNNNAYSDSYGGSGNGGGGGGGAAYDPADLAYLDDQKARLERQLGRTDTGLKQALEAILNEYNKSQSGVNKQRSRALEDFNDKREISESGRSRELGKVDTSARMLADSLRQRIGLASGSGSSAYQVAAPRAVQRQASEQRGDVLEDYSANFQALDKDETRAKEDFANLLEDLAAQRREREGGVRRDITEQRNEIRSNLGSLAGQRQKLLGGGYDKIREAMRPYDDQIRQGESLIDSIFNKYTTKYNVKPVQVRDTQLRDYAIDRAAIRDNAATGNQSDYAPYKTYLDDEEELGLV